MTNANECTCPSGDGSLRHPCPAHPAPVELAGVAATLTFINGRPAMCGCQVEYSSGGGEYSDVIYVTLCAKHSGSAILDLVATNRIALTPEYEGQWHADLYLDREVPLAKAEGATPAEAVLALMSAERIDPEQESVEQAGGDERAAFEAWLAQAMSKKFEPEFDLAKYEDSGEYRYSPAADYWKAWQARAALAQPSPAQAEQAEPERPEVVAWQYRVTAGPQTGWSLWHPGKGEEFERSYTVERRPLMTVAQHAAGVARWAEMFNRVEQERDAERAEVKRLINVCASLDSEKREMEHKRDAIIAMHDAALARVAELETALEPFAAVADAYDDSEDDDHEPYTDMGCDDSLRLTLGQHRAGRIALEGRTPQAQAQHSVPDGAADLCRFLAKLYCELDGLRYSTAKLPAEQIADALIFKWPVLQGARNQLNIKRISEQPYDESKLHSAIAAMLAAAPGKEVPQAWIDVQEERRRQITAEGWTPEHDDEHADGQMAQAAGCYALHAGGIGTDWPDGRQNGSALFWPWDKDSWKPTTPRRDLVKACALALAEIERLDRAGISQSPQPGATTASS